MAPNTHTEDDSGGVAPGISHLGRYQVIGRLATGGMAEVYLALAGELSGFRTLVVVKRILPHLASNQQFIRMFLDEARIAALLDHPNVVRIIEVGHDGDEYFLVMELVQGKPLSAVLRKAAKEKSPLTPALAAFVVAQAANGVGYAHDLVGPEGQPLGVVHRDVSPQNVLVSFEGAVKVIDFGIARALGRVTETSPGGLKGKIEYMSPEQASAEEVDRRSDVFALGVVLWEALTGRRLFRRDTELGTMRAIVDDPIPRPSEMLSVSPVLDAIVMRALQKRREARFQTAQEMALALERFAFSSEGFSPLQLATYTKGLFDVEFAQWKKTVSSALEMEAHPGRQSGTRFPIVKADLQTRGPTVALRQAGSASGLRPGYDVRGDSRLLAGEPTTGAPSKRDRLWVYGGVTAIGLISLAGLLVLSRPRAGRPAAGTAATLPVAPPPAAAAITQEPLPPRTPPTEGPAPAPPDDSVAPPKAAEAAKAAKAKSHGGKGGGRRGRGKVARGGARGESVSTDHRPNPFE